MTLDSRQDEPGSAPEPIGADFIIPLLVLCLVHMARMGVRIARRHATLGTGDLFADNLFNRQRLGLAALAVLFVATIQWTGTTLGLLLFLIGSMLVLGVRNIRILAGISIIPSALVYVLLIVLLSSRLPQGPIEKLLAPLVGGS